MDASNQQRVEVIESRWNEYRVRPRHGELFVGRRRAEVFPTLFLMGKDGRPVYYADPSTILGGAGEIFTHWLHVGETLD